MRGIHRGPVNSPHKWPVTRKKFPFDDVIMEYPSKMVECPDCGTNFTVINNIKRYCAISYISYGATLLQTFINRAPRLGALNCFNYNTSIWKWKSVSWSLNCSREVSMPCRTSLWWYVLPLFIMGLLRHQSHAPCHLGHEFNCTPCSWWRYDQIKDNGQL